MSPRPARGRVRCATVATALCAIASLVSVSPAQAAPAGTSSPRGTVSTDAAIVARQEPLLAVTDRIIDLTRNGEASGYEGFADIAIAPTGDYIQLYWHGRLPATITDLLARSAATARVQVIPAAHTARELDALAARLARRRADLAAQGLPVVRIRHLPGAAGLEVGIDPVAAPALRTSAAARADATARLAAVTGSSLPLTVVSSRQAALSGSRDQDTSPWWGGSRIVRPGDVKCTSGFPVSIGSANYLVTAGHCGGINTSWDVGPLYTGGSGSPAFLGTEVNRVAADDTAIIRVGAVQSYVYDKGWDSTVGEHVIGKHDSVVNGYICTEGSTAGVRCNGKIIVTNDLEWFNNIGWIWHLDEAQSPSLINASGDSGGPVIMNSSTPGYVYVAGTITGYDTNYTIDCPQGLDPNVYAPNCSNTVFYEDVNQILSDWGAQVITWL